jgi:hypothetical protein
MLLRLGRIPIAVSVIVVCVLTFVVMGQAFRGLIIVAFGLTGWRMFVRLHRRRYRRAAAKLPSWNIDPE